MSWTTSLSDLRTLLNDNSEDCLRSKKKCFGTVNGSNLSFKTFEFRRVTNFTDAVSSAAPLGVFITSGGITTRVDPSNISADYPDTGDFTLNVAVVPTSGMVVQASYYAQLFLDSELTSIIQRSTQSLQLGTDPTQVDPALWDAVLNYSAAECLKKLSMKYTMAASSTYLLEDAPKKEMLEVASTFQSLGKTYTADAFKIRDAFYTRAGQTLAPNFVANYGRVSAVTPKR